MTRATILATVREYLAAERELETARRLSTPEALGAMFDPGIPGGLTIEARQQAARDRYRDALIVWGQIQDEADGGAG